MIKLYSSEFNPASYLHNSIRLSEEYEPCTYNYANKYLNENDDNEDIKILLNNIIENLNNLKLKDELIKISFMELNNDYKFNILCDFNELVYQYNCEFTLNIVVIDK